MKTKDEAMLNPAAGDKWRMSYGEEYVIKRFADGYVYDECTKGHDAGKGELSNPLGRWQVWASAANAEYLGGAE